MSKKKKFDPVEMLRTIAADESAGSTVRVMACKALIAHENDADDQGLHGKDLPPSDAVTKRALRLLNGGKS